MLIKDLFEGSSSIIQQASHNIGELVILEIDVDETNRRNFADPDSNDIIKPVMRGVKVPYAFWDYGDLVIARIHGIKSGEDPARINLTFISPVDVVYPDPVHDKQVGRNSGSGQCEGGLLRSKLIIAIIPLSNKDATIKFMLKHLKHSDDPDAFIEHLIKIAKQHHFDYPEFATIEKSIGNEI